MPNNLQLVTNQTSLQNSFALADAVVYKTYLDHLDEMEVVPCPNDLQGRDINSITRFFKIERFVYAKNENNRDKLMSVFQAVSRCTGSVIILINSTGEKIDFYTAVRSDNINDLNDSAEVLSKSFAGNFPGTTLAQVPGGNAIKEMLENVFANKSHKEQPKRISTITGIAGLRRKEEGEAKLFVQGMEKLIDSMQGEQYSLLLIADPVPQMQIEQIRRGYETLYSELSPRAGHDLNFGENESQSVSDTMSEGVSESINKSVSDTLSYTHGTSRSLNEGGSVSGSAHAGIIIFGASGSVGKSWGKSWGDNESQGTSRGSTEGSSLGTTRNESRTDSQSRGQSRGIQVKFENKTVKNLLEKINAQLKRLDASVDTGMWNCSVYCLADNPSTSKIVASAYQALLRGENSSVEAGSITVWSDKKTGAIMPWLAKMHHPRLLMNNNLEITPTSFISSAELAIHAGIPQTSVGGLPVLTMAAFGREVVVNRDKAITDAEKATTEENTIRLGRIYHMGKIDTIEEQKALPVCLDKDSLSSHTFITGSTGSGKSNTAYQILDEIARKGVRFMVIEPAKGEYKQVFGGRDDVAVYGTNPQKSPLLRINPFKFPWKDIHVLEHLDRLVEIFNVCWPMYAAMPAVLKDSIEASYRAAGWDLRTSCNSFDPPIFPTFNDVVVNLTRIIDSSAYSDELKGNYKGSLETRLKSLTNGINGMIFVNDELSAETLFDANVIVDLSRVGSMETKALIMGLLVMKLQEHRMTSGKMNSPLRHITVLEEAHNLLKRTSTEQSSESSNLLGKSVEMLANAIAEMRTYGEGFIIADQSPGLLDMSAIRNTNTKIILRLPDQGDRELVGKAAGLNNDQITELSKLQCGVAAVYQNDWIQPVLCKVDYFASPEKPYRYECTAPFAQAQDTVPKELIQEITLYLLSQIDLDKEKVDKLAEQVLHSNIENGLKLRLHNYLLTQKPNGNMETITDIIAGLFPLESTAFRRYRAGFPLTAVWAESFYNEIRSRIDFFDPVTQGLILDCIIVECSMNTGLNDLPVQWHELDWRIENGSNQKI